MLKLYLILLKIKIKSFIYHRVKVPWMFLELAFLLFTRQLILIRSDYVQAKKGVKNKYLALVVSKLPLSDQHQYNHYPFS